MNFPVTDPTPADFPVAVADLDRLRSRLAVEAAGAGLLDVGYHIVDTPIGQLLLAATDRGLVRIAFAREDFDTVLAGLAERLGPRILAAPDQLADAGAQVADYFAGERRSFTVPLDLSLSSGFRRRVQEMLPEIEYGRTRSYKELAELAGNPKAVRAVGTACATNPLPVVVPCHRVLRSDGAIGGYLGGAEAKRFLLDHERAA